MFVWPWILANVRLGTQVSVPEAQTTVPAPAPCGSWKVRFEAQACALHSHILASGVPYPTQSLGPTLRGNPGIQGESPQDCDSGGVGEGWGGKVSKVLGFMGGVSQIPYRQVLGGGASRSRGNQVFPGLS